MKIRYYIILVLTLLLGFNKTEAQEYGGVVDIYTNGGGDTIYVDDIYIGKSPLIVTLSYGEHKIIAQRGDETATLRVLVAPTGGDTSVMLTFTAGAGNGIFSVSSSKKVNFSKGNLQYKASTNTWRFAKHQWDIIGEDNKNISSSYDGWIDLFGWGTGNHPTENNHSQYNYSSFSEWGNNIISNGKGRIWFTLTQDEWEYVLEKRSGIRYAKAIVNGVNGIILLPDDWRNSYYRLNNTNRYMADFIDNCISENDWMNKLEANGAVFLPVAGIRNWFGFVDGYRFFGIYWTATSDDNSTAYRVFFDYENLGVKYSIGRYQGCSVRLVTLAK